MAVLAAYVSPGFQCAWSRPKGRSRGGTGLPWVPGGWVQDFVNFSWAPGWQWLLVRFCTAPTVLSAAFTFQIFFFLKVIDTSTDRLQAILGSIKVFLLFFRCSFARNALSVISLFRRTLDSFMFTACSAPCRYTDMHKSFTIKWATMQEHKCITQVDTCSSLQETLMEFFGFSVNAESSWLWRKQTETDCLLQESVKNPVPQWLCMIALQKPEEKLAFKAWKRSCCQLILAGGKSS